MGRERDNGIVSGAKSSILVVCPNDVGWNH